MNYQLNQYRQLIEEDEFKSFMERFYDHPDDAINVYIDKDNETISYEISYPDCNLVEERTLIKTFSWHIECINVSCLHSIREYMLQYQVTIRDKKEYLNAILKILKRYEVSSKQLKEERRFKRIIQQGISSLSTSIKAEHLEILEMNTSKPMVVVNAVNEEKLNWAGHLNQLTELFLRLTEENPFDSSNDPDKPEAILQATKNQLIDLITNRFLCKGDFINKTSVYTSLTQSHKNPKPHKSVYEQIKKTTKTKE